MKRASAFAVFQIASFIFLPRTYVLAAENPSDSHTYTGIKTDSSEALAEIEASTAQKNSAALSQSLIDELKSFLRCPPKERDGSIDRSTQQDYLKRAYRNWRYTLQEKMQSGVFRPSDQFDTQDFTNKMVLALKETGFQEANAQEFATQMGETTGSIYTSIKTSVEQKDDRALRAKHIGGFLELSASPVATNAKEGWDNLWVKFNEIKDSLPTRTTACDADRTARVAEIQRRAKSAVNLSEEQIQKNKAAAQQAYVQKKSQEITDAIKDAEKKFEAAKKDGNYDQATAAYNALLEMELDKEQAAMTHERLAEIAKLKATPSSSDPTPTSKPATPTPAPPSPATLEAPSTPPPPTPSVVKTESGIEVPWVEGMVKFPDPPPPLASANTDQQRAAHKLPKYPDMAFGDNDPFGQSVVELIMGLPTLPEDYAEKIKEAKEANRWDAAEALHLRVVRVRPFNEQYYKDLLDFYMNPKFPTRDLKKAAEIYDLYQEAFKGEKLPKVEKELEQ